MTSAKKWLLAYQISLANAGIFMFLALAMFFFEPRSLVVILSAPALFFLGCIISFLMMIRSGGYLSAIAWFVLGSGIFFGMGGVAGGLHVHPHADYLFADDNSYLLYVNLLNACSVFIVLATAYFLVNIHEIKVSQQVMSSANTEYNLRRIFPYIVAISAIGVGLKYALFPVAESLLLRGMTGKIYFIIPSCFLLLGLLWHSIGWQLKLIAGSVFLLEILNGLVGLTKYQIVVAILSLVFGMLIFRRSLAFLLMSSMIVVFIFAAINPLITIGRAHIDYDADKNTVATRLKIITEAANALFLDQDNRIQEDKDSFNKITLDVKEMTTIKSRLIGLGVRFDVATIQGYLINEYNKGNAGNSMVDFWVPIIPRVLWPEKPIVTRFGEELHSQFYYHHHERRSQKGSSAAPSYSGEAYWNFGVPGVVGISILLGLAIGWLTRRWQSSMLGSDPAFFLIAFQVAIWASSVESWVVGTYLAEFMIFVVIYLSLRLIFKFIQVNK